MNGMDYSMGQVIGQVKSFCQENKLCEYSRAVAAVRGILDAVKSLEPDRVYTVAEVCSLLEALHDIDHAGTAQSEKNALKPAS